jgi:hypothetical protein
MEGGYVGHETNTGCPRPKNKNMSLGLAKLSLRPIAALLACEKCSHTCLHATKRKITRKKAGTFSAMEGGYVGHETNAGCPRPEKIKSGQAHKQ